MQRVGELQDIRANASATLSAVEAELNELQDELKNTASDMLDYDASRRKNDFLRRSGLLPKE